MNAHPNIPLAKAQVAQVLADLELFLAGDDEALKLDMIEGETDLFKIVRALLNANEDDAGRIEALKSQIDQRKDRKASAEARIDKRKAVIGSLMDIAQLRTLPLPEATISRTIQKPRAVVTDIDELPDAFVIEMTVRKPDIEAIKVASDGGAIIPGVARNNGGESITVRRK